MTEASLRMELEHMLALARTLSYLPPAHQLAIAFDLFSNSLDVVEGAPIAAAAPRDPAGWQLSPRIMHVASTIQDAAEQQLLALRSAGLDAKTGPASQLPSDALHTIVASGLEALGRA